MNFFFSDKCGRTRFDGDLLLESLEPGALGPEHFRHSTRSKLLDDAVALLLVMGLLLLSRA